MAEALLLRISNITDVPNTRNLNEQKKLQYKIL